jgi:hypothetical protein
MQPQPEPSSVEPATDAPVTTETPPDLSTQPSRATSFLQRLWRGRGGREAGEDEGAQTEEDAKPPEAPQTITLTQEELNKRIDAETQRREAKRIAQADAERKRKLRDEDPWAYVEEERRAEQIAQGDMQVSDMFTQIGATHDRFTIDPLFMAVPEAERTRILGIEGMGMGLEGRKRLVTESLKALEKHWRGEGEKVAEDKLRRNPAFRKQVLNEFRRGMSEPEFVGSGAPSAADKTVSDLLRSQIRARH